MPASLAIHRLTARTPARAQPVAARLALQALGADLEDALPRGLPPQALLWLRRLQLQAPEAALLRPAPMGWRQDWISAGRQQMDAALSQAARPALGPVPDAAPAVLFADAAEMLACLALAAHAGQLDRWWWRGLLGRAWPHPQAAWAARPEAQAAAVRLLVRAGQGGVAAMWFDEPWLLPSVGSDGADVAAVVVRPAPIAGPRASSARPPSPVAEAGGLYPEPLQASSAVDAPRMAPQPRQGSELRPLLAAPSQLAPSMPEAPADVSVPREVTAPTAALLPGDEPCTAMPADDLTAAPASDALAPLAAPRRPRAPAVVEHRDAAVEPPLHQPLADAAVPTAVAPEIADTASASRPTAVSSAGLASPDEPTLFAEPIAGQGPPNAPPASQPPLPSDAAMSALDATGAPEQPDETPTAWPWPQALLSRQAPLLFLVNALLEDGLYPDFTRPRDPGLPVPLWALLPALAEVWRLPADALQDVMRQRCPDWTAPAAMPAAPGVAAAPWADWLPAFARSLRRRLCRRLGLRVAMWPRALTLARPARLWLSEAEWVAEFDLGAHDVAWRLAGLDRDPGWLPSTGISLRFVFAS